MIPVTLTATSCLAAFSTTDPKADFDAWVAFVAARNPEWSVDGDFAENVQDDRIVGADEGEFRASLQADWIAFCADASAWPARMPSSVNITLDNVDTISSVELREEVAEALASGHTLILHRLRGCDVRPDWDSSVVVELLSDSLGFHDVASNGNAMWSHDSEMQGRPDKRPETTAWWMLRIDAEEATENELAAARAFGETWARVQFDAMLVEPTRVLNEILNEILSENASITGTWNRHPAGFPPCADDVAKEAARKTWAKRVEEERAARTAEGTILVAWGMTDPSADPGPEIMASALVGGHAEYRQVENAMHGLCSFDAPNRDWWFIVLPSDFDTDELYDRDVVLGYSTAIGSLAGRARQWPDAVGAVVTFERYWAIVLGELDAAGVVDDCALVDALSVGSGAPGDRIELDEWLGVAEAAAWTDEARLSGPVPDEWTAHHVKALDMLCAAVEKAREAMANGLGSDA